VARPKDNARLISLYVYSDKEKARYSELARNAGAPLSKFLISKIEEALAEKKRNPAVSLKKLEDLKARIHELEEEIRLKDMILEKYQSAVEKQRALPLLDDNFKGKRVIDRSLIDILKKQHGPVFEDRLMALLKVDPSDTELSQSLSRQLEDLEGYGLIKKGSQGWRWVG
jgi:hypothetical protein